MRMAKITSQVIMIASKVLMVIWWCNDKRTTSREALRSFEIHFYQINIQEKEKIENGIVYQHIAI